MPRYEGASIGSVDLGWTNDTMFNSVPVCNKVKRKKEFLLGWEHILKFHFYFSKIEKLPIASLLFLNSSNFSIK